MCMNLVLAVAFVVVAMVILHWLNVSEMRQFSRNLAGGLESIEASVCQHIRVVQGQLAKIRTLVV